jgi:hypothetical protein
MSPNTFNPAPQHGQDKPTFHDQPRKPAPRKLGTFSGQQNPDETSGAARRTEALRGPTGLTRKQNARVATLLKQQARLLFTNHASSITALERSQLQEMVAATLTDEIGRRVSAEQVAKVAQRIRTRADTKRAWPIDVGLEVYALVAREADRAGCSLKAAITEIVLEWAAAFRTN